MSSVALLDINDCNLRLHTPGGPETGPGAGPQPSPGYALLQGKDYRFGADARAAARLEPRRVNTRYWWQLNTEPLQPPLGPARHTADLVHGHLLELHRQAGAPSEILLAAPATMSREQLSLLLGIAQQCPFEVVGLVNRSALLASGQTGEAPGFHLEIQLHQAVLCELASSGKDIHVANSQALPGCGLLQLQERIVEVVAAQFIRQTRFDPRRKAASEQTLYDSLPQLLRTLAQSTEANLEIQGYRARVGRDDLAACGQRLFDSARKAMGAAASSGRVLAEPLLGLLPGAVEGLPELTLTEGDACWRAVAEHGEQLIARDGKLSFIHRLPRLAPAPASEPEPEPTPQPAPQPPPTSQASPAPETAAQAGPTHVLIGSTATALVAEGITVASDLSLYARDGKWLVRSPAPVLVNGEKWRVGQALASGDELVAADGTHLLLIEVLP